MPVIINDQQEDLGNYNPLETWLSSPASGAGGEKSLEEILVERDKMYISQWYI